WCLVATFHSRAVLLESPMARVLPSGLNATEDDELEKGLPIWRPVAMSHSWTERPWAVASVLPSRLNATELIPPKRPVFRAGPICRPVAVFQSRARLLRSSPV